MKKDSVYAVIMAGGGGTRFWPWSREKRPKQVLPILSNRSMIWETVVSGVLLATLVRRSCQYSRLLKSSSTVFSRRA
jgi:UTP-glucose-1-phosphate uridylyltransferase